MKQPVGYTDILLETVEYQRLKKINSGNHNCSGDLFSNLMLSLIFCFLQLNLTM